MSTNGDSRNQRIRHIAITGGPCAGKTSLMSRAPQVLGEFGERVLIVPEVATLVIGGGVSDLIALAENDRPSYLAIQKQISILQMEQRKAFHAIAETLNEPTVILHDRGVVDNAAYMTPSEYEAVLASIGIDEEEAQSLYDVVIHLRTAADGAEEFYTTENNEARSESPEVARMLDQMTMSAWVDHPQLVVVDNSTDFDDKMRRSLDAISRQLGDAPVRRQRRFLINGEADMDSLLENAERAIEIEQTYLTPPRGTDELRIRRREQGGRVSWHRAEIRSQGGGRTTHTEKMIGPRQASELLQRDHLGTVQKTRYIVLHDGQPLRVDIVKSPISMAIVETDVVGENSKVRLPEYLGDVIEITDRSDLSSSGIASCDTEELERVLTQIAA